MLDRQSRPGEQRSVARPPATARRIDQPPNAGPRRLAADQLPNAAGPLPPAAVLGLQQSVGNAAVVQRLTEHEHDDGFDLDVQRSPVHQALSSPGRPLGSEIRTEMEARLGADFSDVRVHTDATAHQAAESVQAHAFTSGSHIVFQRGRYETGSHTGKKMLAHELTHVLQQRSGPVAGTDVGDGLRVSDPSDRFERAAEATAERSMLAPLQRMPVAGPPVPSRVLQRAWEVKSNWREPANDGGTFGRSIAQEDVETIREAVELVTAKAPAGRTRLVYIGVGVGNPATSWGNPTGGPKLNMAEQTRPGFLDKAEQEHFVIAMNFNTGDGARVRELSSSGNGIHVHVNARAPLVTTSDQDRAAVDLLKGLASAEDLLVVMNAVSNAQYEALIELATRKGKGSYLTSYGATGEQHALVPLNKKLGNTKTSKLAGLADVFPQFDEDQ
jgi:hypothetical protein